MLIILFIILASGIGGFCYLGFHINSIDLAPLPEMAGLMFCISNTVGTFSGVVVSIVNDTVFSNNPNADVRTDQCMISADSYAQAKEFWKKKIRTFRVLQKNEELDKQNEVLCPASKEAGRRTTCNDCLLCSGSNIKAKSVAIYQH